MELLQLIGVLLWLVLIIIATVGLLVQLVVHVLVELLILIVRSLWRKVVKAKKGRSPKPDHADALP
ncbi:MAG: hypothetical protein FJX23_04535 [Alphaproteobacteria bacterium]|nr:hypothetical protein [Alphaproteobacteria bacterium]